MQDVVGFSAISARGDLNDPNGTYPLPGMGHVNHAALDYKAQCFKLQFSNAQLKGHQLQIGTAIALPCMEWTNLWQCAAIRLEHQRFCLLMQEILNKFRF